MVNEIQTTQNEGSAVDDDSTWSRAGKRVFGTPTQGNISAMDDEPLCHISRAVLEIQRTDGREHNMSAPTGGLVAHDAHLICAVRQHLQL